MSHHYRGIRGVTFDVGGTLITPWPSVGDIYAEVARRHGYSASPAALNAQFRAAWKNKRNFTHQREQWRGLVNETFLGILPGLPGDDFFADLYECFGRAGAWRVFDDVLPVLAELSLRGFKLAVLSNWDERLRPLLDDLGLGKFFDAFAISIEVGRPKPDRAIFEFAAAQLQIAPTALLHVGDTPDEDVAGALGAGYAALLLDRNGGTALDGSIASLDRILQLLEKPLSPLGKD